MGKNFSCNNASGNRKKSDFYETPYSITRQFLNVERFNYDKVVTEPACGNLAIVYVLKEFWDLDKIVYHDSENDFRYVKYSTDYIITNPPYSKAKQFIFKCKEVCNKKFALLLPLSYLHGKERYDRIYKDREFPLCKVYCFTRYPLLGDALRKDGRYRTGMMVYAWFVWDKNHTGPSTIHWIDNNKYIIRKDGFYI